METAKMKVASITTADNLLSRPVLQPMQPLIRWVSVDGVWRWPYTSILCQG